MPLRDHLWCILVAKYGAFLITIFGAFVITDYIFVIRLLKNLIIYIKFLLMNQS